MIEYRWIPNLTEHLLFSNNLWILYLILIGTSSSHYIIIQQIIEIQMHLKFWPFIWTKFTKKINYNLIKYIKIQKSFKKLHFLSFSLLEKKILLKKVDFFIIFVHMNVQNFRNIMLQ